MKLYTWLLRIIIHLFAVINLVAFTWAGAVMGPGQYIGVDFGGPVTGGIVGFLAGLFFVGLFAGVIALLFEIRDNLKAIREEGAIVKTQTWEPPRQAEIDAGFDKRRAA